MSAQRSGTLDGPCRTHFRIRGSRSGCPQDLPFRSHLSSSARNLRDFQGQLPSQLFPPGPPVSVTRLRPRGMPPAASSISSIATSSVSPLNPSAAATLCPGLSTGPAWSDQYFAAIFIPDDPANTVTITLRNSIDIPKETRSGQAETTKADVLGAAVGDPQGPTVERLYVGPKQLHTLETVPVTTIVDAPQDLRGLVNFGFFG